MDKYNHSAVNIHGRSIKSAEQAIAGCWFLNSNLRGLLFWVLHRDQGQISVKSIRTAFSMGDKKWVNWREKLRQNGILVQTKTLLSNRSTLWTLTFDFKPIFDAAEKGGDHAGASDPCEMMIPPKGGDHAGAHVIPREGGDHGRGLTINTNAEVGTVEKAKAKKPPPPAVARSAGGGGEYQVDQRAQGEVTRLSKMLGLNGPRAEDLDRKSRGASMQQLEFLRASYAAGSASGKIKDEGAWLIQMAAKASRGEITGQPPASAPAVRPPRTLEEDLLSVGLTAGCTIQCPATSKQWTVHESGWTRNSVGLLVTPETTRMLIQRVRAGELSVSQ